MKLSTLAVLAISLASVGAHAQSMKKPNLLDKLFPKKPISMVKKSDPCFVKQNSMLPRGSSLITQLGEMTKDGIVAILHAATGAMTRSGGEFEPNPESIGNSILNSLKLARSYEHKRVAIPFIGGGIFAGRMGVTKEELTEIIVKATLKNKKRLEVVFVLFSDAEEKMFSASVEKNAKNDPKVKVVKGSITDFSVHGASAIVNAANMEVVFGGGISGVIGSATGQAEEIDEKAAELIEGVAKQCSKEYPVGAGPEGEDEEEVSEDFTEEESLNQDN